METANYRIRFSKRVKEFVRSLRVDTFLFDEIKRSKILLKALLKNRKLNANRVMSAECTHYQEGPLC